MINGPKNQRSKKIFEIARVCAPLSKSASTSEERDTFADLANKWQKFAIDARHVSSPRQSHPKMNDPTQ